MKRLVEHVLSIANVMRIFATCRPENAASISILKKIGMRQERRLRNNVLIRGEWRDTLIFELLIPKHKT